MKMRLVFLYGLNDPIFYFFFVVVNFAIYIFCKLSFSCIIFDFIYFNVVKNPKTKK